MTNVNQNEHSDNQECEDEIENDVKSEGLGYRHVQTLLLFLSLAMGYIMRSNLSVAIIAMTDKSSNHTDVQTYDWDKKTQDFVLSSFFWGYTLMQIPSGQLAQRYGAKKLLINAMTVNGLVSVMFPYLVHWGGWQTACALRVLQGLTQSCLLPSMQIYLSKWAPLPERSRLGNFAMSGAPFGTIVSMPAVGWLSSHYGWPSTFQVIGALSMTMAAAIFFLASDRPSQHPKISEKERTYIESSLGQKGEHRVLKTPWKSIFTSVPFLALLIAQVGCNWGYLTMLLEIPSYLSLVLGINTKMSGTYASLPYIAMFLTGFVISFISDFVINSKYVSITHARKISNTIGCLFLGFGSILLTFIPTEDIVLSLTILTLSLGACGGFNCGILLNYVDLAPNFAGTLMGITNCIANAVGVLAPISVGLILTNPNDIIQWRIVFIMICVIVNGANLLFVVFGTSVCQTWNEVNDFKDLESPVSNNAEESATREKLMGNRDN